MHSTETEKTNTERMVDIHCEHLVPICAFNESIASLSTRSVSIDIHIEFIASYSLTPISVCDS